MKKVDKDIAINEGSDPSDKYNMNGFNLFEHPL